MSNLSDTEAFAQWLHTLLPTDQHSGRTSGVDELLANMSRLRPMLPALDENVDDTLDCETCQNALPDLIQMQQSGVAPNAEEQGRFEEVATHLVFCPYCSNALVQVLDWMSDSVSDHVASTVDYPQFDLDFLTGEPTSSKVEEQTKWAENLVHSAREAGKQWFEDTLGGVYILFSSQLQTRPAAGFAVKSRGSGMQLAYLELGEDELNDWEIDTSIIADEMDPTLCSIEVSLYPLHGSEEIPMGMTIEMRYGDTIVRQETDARGGVEFSNVPVAVLEELVIRVQTR